MLGPKWVVDSGWDECEDGEEGEGESMVARGMKRFHSGYLVTSKMIWRQVPGLACMRVVQVTVKEPSEP